MSSHPHPTPPGRGRPVRRDFSYRMTSDEDGEPIIEFLEADAFSLSHEGSIDRKTITQENYHGCGHSKMIPSGGCCGEPGCRRTSCAQCFQDLVCQNCRKPLCGPHAKRLTISPSVFVTVCFHCYGTLRRRRILTAIGRLLARPFIAFNNPNGE
jgi:hypothetical protein